jgi:hypothetical protein
MEAAVDVGEKNGSYSNGFHALSASCMVGLLLAVKDKKLIVDSVVANGPVFRAGNAVWKGDMLQVMTPPTIMSVLLTQKACCLGIFHKSHLGYTVWARIQHTCIYSGTMCASPSILSFHLDARAHILPPPFHLERLNALQFPGRGWCSLQNTETGN